MTVLRRSRPATRPLSPVLRRPDRRAGSCARPPPQAASVRSDLARRRSSALFRTLKRSRLTAPGLTIASRHMFAKEPRREAGRSRDAAHALRSLAPAGICDGEGRGEARQLDMTLATGPVMPSHAFCFSRRLWISFGNNGNAPISA